MIDTWQFQKRRKLKADRACTCRMTGSSGAGKVTLAASTAPGMTGGMAPAAPPAATRSDATLPSDAGDVLAGGLPSAPPIPCTRATRGIFPIGG